MWFFHQIMLTTHILSILDMIQTPKIISVLGGAGVYSHQSFVLDKKRSLVRKDSSRTRGHHWWAL